MPSVFECAMLSEDVYHDFPTIVRGHTPVAVPRGEPYCRNMEFAGGAYTGSAEVGVIAFRGSREMVDWKGANLQIIRRQLPAEQLGCALAYFAAAHRALAAFGCTRFVLVGHSLGGGLAAAVAGIVTWVPVRGVTFNAPGLGEFSSGLLESGLERAIAGDVHNFRTARDIVSRWGTHIGCTHDIPGVAGHGIRSCIDELGITRFADWEI